MIRQTLLIRRSRLIGSNGGDISNIRCSRRWHDDRRGSQWPRARTERLGEGSRRPPSYPAAGGAMREGPNTRRHGGQWLLCSQSVGSLFLFLLDATTQALARGVGALTKHVLRQSKHEDARPVRQWMRYASGGLHGTTKGVLTSREVLLLFFFSLLWLFFQIMVVVQIRWTCRGSRALRSTPFTTHSKRGVVICALQPRPFGQVTPLYLVAGVRRLRAFCVRFRFPSLPLLI